MHTLKWVDLSNFYQNKQNEAGSVFQSLSWTGPVFTQKSQRASVHSHIILTEFKGTDMWIYCFFCVRSTLNLAINNKNNAKQLENITTKYFGTFLQPLNSVNLLICQPEYLLSSWLGSACEAVTGDICVPLRRRSRPAILSWCRAYIGKVGLSRALLRLECPLRYLGGNNTLVF